MLLHQEVAGWMGHVVLLHQVVSGSGHFVQLHQVVAGWIGVGTFRATTPSSCPKRMGHVVLLHRVVTTPPRRDGRQQLGVLFDEGLLRLGHLSHDFLPSLPGESRLPLLLVLEAGDARLRRQPVTRVAARRLTRLLLLPESLQINTTFIGVTSLPLMRKA